MSSFLNLQSYTTGHTELVACITVTPDNQYVVTGSVDTTVRITRLKDAKLHRVLTGHVLPVCALAVTPDSRYVLSGAYDRTIRITRIDDDLDYFE